MRASFNLVLLLVWLLFVGLAWLAAVPLRAWRRVPVAEIIRGTASWYGEEYRGRPMANGERFDPEAMTCAMREVPLGSLVQVRHAESGRCVVLEVTDRGPAAWTKCVVDLSSRAFRKLEDPARGHFPAVITVLRRGPEVAP
jgi:rare lipoprotein A